MLAPGVPLELHSRPQIPPEWPALAPGGPPEPGQREKQDVPEPILLSPFLALTNIPTFLGSKIRMAQFQPRSTYGRNYIALYLQQKKVGMSGPRVL